MTWNIVYMSRSCDISWHFNLVTSLNIFRHVSQVKVFLLEWVIWWFVTCWPCGNSPDIFHKWKVSPQCESVDVFLNYKLGWISLNKFHIEKISRPCVSVDVLLNDQHGGISSNKFHMWNVSPQYVIGLYDCVPMFPSTDETQPRRCRIPAVFRRDALFIQKWDLFS